MESNGNSPVGHHSDSAGEKPPPEKKKKTRPSIKDIKMYEFTETQEIELIKFIKEHEVLYDRNHRHFSHNKMKMDLWTEVAKRFPKCTGPQAKKHYDKKSSDYGKLDKKLTKSGSAARPLTLIQKTLQER